MYNNNLMYNIQISFILFFMNFEVSIKTLYIVIKFNKILSLF